MNFIINRDQGYHIGDPAIADGNAERVARRMEEVSLFFRHISLDTHYLYLRL